MSPLTVQRSDVSAMRPKVPKSLDLFTSNTTTTTSDRCTCPSNSNKKRSLMRTEGKLFFWYTFGYNNLKRPWRSVVSIVPSYKWACSPPCVFSTGNWARYFGFDDS